MNWCARAAWATTAAFADGVDAPDWAARSSSRVGRWERGVAMEGRPAALLIAAATFVGAADEDEDGGACMSPGATVSVVRWKCEDGGWIHIDIQINRRGCLVMSAVFPAKVLLSPAGASACRGSFSN